jgi:hypothetical protein
MAHGKPGMWCARCGGSARRIAAVLNHLGDGVAVGVVEVGERVDDVILTCGSLFLSFADNFTTLSCETAIKLKSGYM